MNQVHFVLPNDIDDPARPSGGNIYDRRVIDGLAGSGWAVTEHSARGAWPSPSPHDLAQLGRCLAQLPPGAITVLDGLVACAAGQVIKEHATRLRLVVLMHMPPAGAGEEAAMAVADAVVTTSQWCRNHLLNRYQLPPERVHVAIPGVCRQPVAAGSAAGSSLLSVGAVLPHKGHDLLARALAGLAELPFQLTCVGSTDLDPDYAAAVRRQLHLSGVAQRVTFTGPLTGKDLRARFAEADLLVVASRADSYGMAVTEALAHGLPVLATTAQGLPEAVGRTPEGAVPGLLVPPGDPAALRDALARWLGSQELRQQLRKLARQRRATLADWAATTAVFAALLAATASGRLQRA